MHQYILIKFLSLYFETYILKKGDSVFSKTNGKTPRFLNALYQNPYV